MALPSVDMSVCTPKNKCLSGPNEGLLYNRDNPCSFGADFDPLKCDCVPWLASDEVQYRIISGTGIKIRGGAEDLLVRRGDELAVGVAALRFL